MMTLRKPPDKDREQNRETWRKLKGEKGWELVSFLERNKSNPRATLAPGARTKISHSH